MILLATKRVNKKMLSSMCLEQLCLKIYKKQQNVHFKLREKIIISRTERNANFLEPCAIDISRTGQWIDVKGEQGSVFNGNNMNNKQKTVRERDV